MALNSHDYQLGSNPGLLSLWGARLSYKTAADVDWVEAQLKTGERVHARQSKSTSRFVFEEDPVAVLLRVRHPCLKVRRCAGRLWHVHIFGRKAASRARLRALNHVFPWTEFEDRQKTNLDLASLVFWAIRHGMLKAVNQALSVCPVGQCNTVVTAMVVAACGNAQWPRLYDLLKKDRACCMSTTGFRGYFKALSTAVRRTSRWVDGELLDITAVANLAYFELSTGRAGNLTDWGEEVSKRCGPRLVLKNPYTGGSFLPLLRRHLAEIVGDMMPHLDKWGTWETFILDRQRWASSGSAGGAKAMVEGKMENINKHSFFEQ